MTLTVSLERHGVPLSRVQEERIRHHLAALERRLARRPEPIAVLTLSGPNTRQEITANLRVLLGPLGPTLTSSQSATAPDAAARLAVHAVERQLERMVAGQRGEHSYGVPSRRRMGNAADLSNGSGEDATTSAEDAT